MAGVGHKSLSYDFRVWKFTVHWSFVCDVVWGQCSWWASSKTLLTICRPSTAFQELPMWLMYDFSRKQDLTCYNCILEFLFPGCFWAISWAGSTAWVWQERDGWGSRYADSYQSYLWNHAASPLHKVMVIPFRKKPQTGINHSTRWFFGHPNLLHTPEVKSIPEPADSEQATASSISVSGNPGESHVDGTKASELISSDRPSTISIRKSLARMWPRQQIQPEFWLIQHHWRDIQRESICSYH